MDDVIDFLGGFMVGAVIGGAVGLVACAAVGQRSAGEYASAYRW